MPSVDAAYPFLRRRHEEENRAALGGVFAEQREDVVARHDAAASTLLSTAWDARVSNVLLERNKATAADFARRVARALGSDFDPDIMDEWLSMNADLGGQSINDATRELLDLAADREEIDSIYNDLGGGSRLTMLAGSAAATASNFGAHDAARSSGATHKMWHVRSGRPRSSHSALDGSTVPIDGIFANGQRWPGDPAGGAAETANCMCSMSYVGGER